MAEAVPVAVPVAEAVPVAVTAANSILRDAMAAFPAASPGALAALPQTVQVEVVDHYQPSEKHAAALQ